jgi:sirohydrochlorin cobaltochelatase
LTTESEKGVSKKGVLVISHGSHDPKWVKEVHDIVSQTGIPVPTTVSFLETSSEDETLSIRQGIETLVRAGTSQILAVPLFLSSFTTHLAEIRSLLNEVQSEPSESCRIQFCEPLNDHPIVADILFDRIREQICPETDGVILAAHGVNDPDLYIRYERMLQRIVQHVQSKMEAWLATVSPPLACPPVRYGTFYPDTLRDVACSVASERTPFVVPLFLAEGYFTKTKIPRKLEGIPFKYNGKALLPHPGITTWLRQQVWGFLHGES